jgi:hypothetical protein
MPTPVLTQSWLGWAYQTGFTNRVKTPSGFLTQLIFGGRERALPTESVELSFKEGERLLAPFVEVNSEALTVGARSTTFANVSCPNIRIKRPMEAYNVFNRRQPGTDIFIGGGEAVSAARAAAIAEDTQYMMDLIANRVEWMVGSMIGDITSGFMTLSYSVAEKANWRVRVPRDTGATITLSGTAEWNDAVGTSRNVVADFHNVKRFFSKKINGTARVAIMDAKAADAFMKLSEVRDLLDKRNVDAGALKLQEQFNDQGAIYLGKFCGVDCWEYSREFVDEDGTTKVFLGAQTSGSEAGRVVFLAQESAFSDAEILYGSIPDHDAFEGGQFVGKRFAKSWKEPDPSVYVQLMQSRPLPFIRQPNAIVVMDVVE